MEAALILTYRCNAKCKMCNTWRYPSARDLEIPASIIPKLPHLKFCNLTGGEPFLREDLKDIVRNLRAKTDRIVISTNGYFTDRIAELASLFPDLGFRISIEGMPAANDDLRGIPEGFERGLTSLLHLKHAGVRDIGFGLTASDRNIFDIMKLYSLAESMNLEFATAVVHNSFYFHKTDNRIQNREGMIQEFRKLTMDLFRSRRIKNWFRAYFNYGLIRYIEGKSRLLPCEAGTENFFLTPEGDVLPCNGSDEPWIMGNLLTQTWDEIWNGKDARIVRDRVRKCRKNCWMIGTAAPVMKKYFKTPFFWVAGNKLRLLTGREIRMD